MKFSIDYMYMASLIRPKLVNNNLEQPGTSQILVKRPLKMYLENSADPVKTRSMRLLNGSPVFINGLAISL